MIQINENLRELLDEQFGYSNAQTLISELNDTEKSTFDRQVKLAKIVFKGNEWFKSDEGQQQLDYCGIVLTKEEFMKDVFGYGKSFFYDMAKVGKLAEETSIVGKYKRECTKLENQNDKQAVRSVKGLLKFAKAVENGEDAEAESTPTNTLMTFSAKAEALDSDKGASMRLTSDGSVVGVTEQSIQALEMLLAKAKEQLNA
tara:strand:- start:388 stop:990 length:603 start_codon:yes stop_codon:yes gene_type:complete